MNKNKLLILVFVLAVLFTGLVFILNLKPKTSTSHQVQSQTESSKNQIDTSNWNAYKNDKYGFEIQYPTDFTINENDSYAVAVGKYASGNGVNVISFSPPAFLNFSNGTSLSIGWPESYIADSPCNASYFLDYGGDYTSKNIVLNNINFTKGEMEDSGDKSFYGTPEAPIFYHATVYATLHNGTCLGIREFISSSSELAKNDNYQALNALFDKILSTFKFTN